MKAPTKKKSFTNTINSVKLINYISSDKNVLIFLQSIVQYLDIP